MNFKKIFLAMKNLFILLVILGALQSLNAQTYPDLEYPNEVYAFQKDSNRLTRLEKQISTLDTKMKRNSVESCYWIDKERSTIRINNSSQFTFVFREDSEMSSTPGLSPESSLSFHSIELYKMEPSKGKRKIAMISSNASPQKFEQAESLPLNFQRISEGYYEFVIDKPLPRGEYAFVIKRNDSLTNEVVIFAIGVE